MSRDITAATQPEATLTIKEMAAQSGMSEYTLRYYEKIGLIKPIPRDGSSGHRRYSADTAQRLETLACLRASGLSLNDMRQYLRLREHGREAAAEQKALFQVYAEKVKESLQELHEKYGDNVLTLTLDVTNKAAVKRTVQQAHDYLGRLDVIINNAGYGLFGAVEEVSEQEARDQMETNLFGALWVTQAALPYLRKQGSRHIIQVSSIGGVNAFANIGIYHASKWGLEGFSQALNQEVQPLGIKVTLIEPVGYTTDWAGPSARFAQELPAYEHVREANRARRGASSRGNPEATGPVVLKLVDMEQPPLRLFLGKGAHAAIHAEYEKRLAEWDTFKDLSEEAHGE